MVAYVEFFIDKGATFNSVINLADDVTNASLNLTNYTVRSQMRRSYYSANASATFTCTVTDALNGEITLSLDSDATSLLKNGRYVFDIETIDTSNTITRIIEGTVFVTPEVTR